MKVLQVTTTPPGAQGGGTRARHFNTAGGPLMVELLQYTAVMPWDNGQWEYCTTLPFPLGTMGSGTLLRATTLPWGSRQWEPRINNGIT